VGESLAGLFVVETLVLEPELFDTFIAFDPSLWWNDGKLTIEARQRQQAKPVRGKRLFIATSDDATTAAQRFVQAFGASDPAAVTWHLEPMPEEKHSTIFHPAALRAFRALFAPRVDVKIAR
jgi:hypothetical protein